MSLIPLPSFADLPLRIGDPPNSAWGLWTEHGFDDQLGALNYLTDDLAKKTIQEEVKTGKRVGLNLALDFINPPLLGRVGFSKQIIRKDPRVINDDVITFNTQGSSQWDSFRHFAYQKQAKFYNGVTQEHIHGDEAANSVNGIGAWAPRCIAGRAVLIDYASFAQKNGIEYDALGRHGIPLTDILTIAKESNISFHPGDIFMLRTGFVAAYKAAPKEKKQELADKKPPQFCGLGQSKETIMWLWERQFAAVAADAPAFECSPALDPEWHLHPILLAGWGTPIGELFDLEELSKTCKELGRWSFFVSSAPLNYAGAVASPPNAIAFF
ncbi:hypothetical protein L207DRAFT_563864 [Hyaloscypha variabilis F]|uniref:Cyclase n=1 Tax=Hyaloscypha variabilis (strain UAMH 11265 / GT02V1 / F) TaxID=1149755 RepID=A0A2J6RX76_HYAVF|nr:hypothetical protein L207DRAFT_563864 [Hyaloscypha variabilis F]